ncbi:hypothetical protein PsYK624_061560 [Phanerochaete sordida]|uniref:F-box domain-containing protein n=1 Tax=Phanerochaete sordida TaxID=48140 RepID=A0A9P3G8T9_9APHY|nr:hypothetical protein PsYK624_061560 [Phanerochaete sordida]
MDIWPPPPPFPVSTVTTAEDVDAITTKLFDIARSFNSYRNTLAPISCLLPELLLEIFELLAGRHEVGDFGPIGGTAQFYRWIKVTHVCSAWRRLALNSPFLWCHIEPEWPKAEKAFLERSGNCPLTFLGYAHRIPAEYLVKYGPRLRAIGNVRMTEDSLLSIEASNPGKPLELPLLECLHVGPMDRQRPMLEFSQARIPRLRYLKLYYSWPQGATLLRPTITHLEVHTSSVDSKMCRPLPSWLDMLQGLPLLEYLYLSNGISSPSMSDTMTLLPSVELPHLRTIHLCHTSGNVKATVGADFLAHLRQAPLTKVVLEGSKPELDFQDFAEVVRTLADRLPAWSLASNSQPLDVLSIASRTYSQSGSVKMKLKRSTGRGSVRISLDFGHNFVGPRWGDADRTRHTDELLFHLLSSPLGADVRSLQLHDASGYAALEHADGWLALHAAYTQLTSVGLSTTAQLLRFMDSVEAALDSGAAFLPALEMLIVYTPFVWPPARLVPSCEPESMERRLAELMWRRRELGLGPLYFHLVNFDQDEITEIDNIEVYDERDEEGVPRTKRTRLTTGIPL